MRGSFSETQERILDATQHLFFAHGMDGISMRAVTKEAGVNIAAVNYHFGSKAALIGAMARRFLDEVNTHQLEALDALVARVDLPAVEDVLIAYATPIFTLFDTYRGRDWGQAWMYARMGTNEQPGHDMLRGMHPITLEEVSPVTRRYCELLQRILPALPLDELLWRFGRASNLIMANQGKRSASMPGISVPQNAPVDERAWLIAFLAGGLQAPATGEAGIAQKLRGL